MNVLQLLAAKAWGFKRRIVHDPVLDVPEFSGRISLESQLRYGPDALNCQSIADNLLLGVQYVVGASVEGDVAEFGCMTGRTAFAIAAALSTFRTEKRLHLFDSFQGLPPSVSSVDQQSVHVRDGVWAPGTCKGISPAALREKCRRFLPDDRILIYEGWFSDTLRKVSSGTRWSLLHVDCDLYQSALDVLDHAFATKMVAEGALILFDDWNCNRAAEDSGERRVWREMCAKYRIRASDCGSYGWAAHKFIVHSYSA